VVICPSLDAQRLFGLCTEHPAGTRPVEAARSAERRVPRTRSRPTTGHGGRGVLLASQAVVAAGRAAILERIVEADCV
jgi:hypothetical protein